MRFESSKIDIFNRTILISKDNFCPISSAFNGSNKSKLYIFFSKSSLKTTSFLSYPFLLSLSEMLNSDKISSACKTIFAQDESINLFVQAEFALKISQGTANTSFHKSRASFAVISEPDFSFASMITTHCDNPATISFLIGKL
jgi:hypothetical protein